MKTDKLMLCVIGFMLLFTVAAAIAADAPKLKIKFSTVQIKNEQSTHVYGVNNAEWMVGRYVDSAGNSHGFLRSPKGKFTTLDDPNWGGTFSECSIINSHNVIVGDYLNSSGIDTSFIYQKGHFRDIGPANSAAEGINDSGFVTGVYLDSTGQEHGYVWHRNKWKTLDKPGALGTIPEGINNKGLIAVIWVDKAGNTESSLYNSHTKEYRLINVPGAVNTYAHSIDSAGDVVYAWDDSNGRRHGALCTNCWSKTGRKYYKFDDPDAGGLVADGINDHNLIVGVYLTTGDAGFEGLKAKYHVEP